MALDVEAVLRLSRDLQRAETVKDLLVATRANVRRSTPYRTVWFGALSPGLPRVMELLAVSGEEEFEEVALQRAGFVPVDGDAMMEEIVSVRGPVVVEDARVDPRTDKAMVEQLGNRTIINIPLLVGDERIGTMGIGTYHPEPPLPPTADQLELLVVFATVVAAAFHRSRLLERQRALQVELQAARRMESLALLAGGVAHDFNNLLSAILSGLSFVADGPLTAAQRKELAEVVATSQRAAELTKRLLAMGRRQALKLEPIDLAARLRSLPGLLRELIPGNVEVVLESPDAIPRVMGDGGQLDRVLVTLCLDARDAMPDGGTLTLRSRLVDGEVAPGEEEAPGRLAGAHVCVEVADSGRGLEPELLARVFEPSFTDRAPGQGTGIGLAMALGIAKQHGGALVCSSTPGAGRTFRLLLPVSAGA